MKGYINLEPGPLVQSAIMMFLDRKIGMVETEKANAWYLTKRDYVERITSY